MHSKTHNFQNDTADNIKSILIKATTLMVMIMMMKYFILKFLVGILPNIVALFEFSSLNCFPISLTETTLNEIWSTFSNFSFMSKILGWFLYLLIALSTGSIILELESIIYEFSLIFRVFVAFWKQLFSSSATKVSSDLMFSSLCDNLIAL